MRDSVSHARLLELLAYDPATGIFTCKIKRKILKPGDIAGCAHNDGYWAIRLDGLSYMAHRLAWFYVTGRWPREIDHRDTVRTNNAFANLRDSKEGQNNYNRRKQKNNTSGFKGVYLDKQTDKWKAQISADADGKRQFLGRFNTPEEAHEAYRAAALRLHGEFARAA